MKWQLEPIKTARDRRSGSSRHGGAGGGGGGSFVRFVKTSGGDGGRHRGRTGDTSLERVYTLDSTDDAADCPRGPPRAAPREAIHRFDWPLTRGAAYVSVPSTKQHKQGLHYRARRDTMKDKMKITSQKRDKWQGPSH